MDISSIDAFVKERAALAEEKVALAEEKAAFAQEKKVVMDTLQSERAAFIEEKEKFMKIAFQNGQLKPMTDIARDYDMHKKYDICENIKKIMCNAHSSTKIEFRKYHRLTYCKVCNTFKYNMSYCPDHGCFTCNDCFNSDYIGYRCPLSEYTNEDKMIVKKNKCKQPYLHTMYKIKLRNNVVCDICKDGFETGESVFCCRICDHDICPSCAWNNVTGLKNKINATSRNDNDDKNIELRSVRDKMTFDEFKNALYIKFVATAVTFNDYRKKREETVEFLENIGHTCIKISDTKTGSFEWCENIMCINHVVHRSQYENIMFE